MRNFNLRRKYAFLSIGLFFLLICSVTAFEIVAMSRENQIETVKKNNEEIFEKINYTAFSKMAEAAQMLAEDNFIIQLCLQNNTADYNKVKTEIDTVQKTFGLELCYIMETTGLVIASSKYSKDKSLSIEGENYGFRPYYTEAMEGRNVIYPALGSTTRTRGVYFSSPVKNSENKVIGVVVCKIGMDVFDEILSKFPGISAVSTGDGIIFSTSRSNWLYKSIIPLTEEKNKNLLSSKQFSNITVEPIGLLIDKNNAYLGTEKYLIAQRPIGATGWTLLTMKKYEAKPLLSSMQQRFIFIIFMILIILLITIILLINNILKRREAESMHSKLYLAVQQSSSIVVITDTRGLVEYINPKFSEITGYSLQESIGKNISILRSGHHNEEFYKNMWRTILSGKDWRGTFCNKRKNGEIYWDDTLISSVKDHKGRITDFIAIKEDITKRRELEEMLNRYATTDEMTGTLNRRSGMLLMEKQLQLSERHHQNFVIFFMDINGLKSVNDSLGHSFGDELITLAVSVLKETLRESDSICRLGGDEFLVILPMTKITEAEAILQRIHAKVEKINCTDRYSYILSISFGASEYSAGNKLTVDDLIRIADENMYANKLEIKKKQGNNGVLRVRQDKL